VTSVFRAAPALALLLLIAASQPGGTGLQSSGSRLGTVKALRCSFQAAARGAWTQGTARVDSAASSLALEFTDINADEGTATAVTASGRSDIIARMSGGALHLLQMSSGAPLAVTTVWPTEAAPGRFIAVHSRHEYTAVSLPGFTSRPEQNYGWCATP
jgi:hypothetical protein